MTDCATILEAIASYDKKDSTSIARDDLKFTDALVDDVKGLKIGIPRDYFGEGLDPEVKEAVLNAAKVLEEKGAVVEEFDLSLVEYAIPAYYVIACAEASSNLARFDGVKYGYRAKEYESAAISPLNVLGESLTDCIILLISAVILFVLAKTKKTMSRWEGAVCVLLYIVYTAYLLVR